MKKDLWISVLVLILLCFFMSENTTRAVEDKNIKKLHKSKTANENSSKKIQSALVEVPDVPGLPRILLLGDSISVGYTKPVRAQLHERANVHRPPELCKDTQSGLLKLDSWLGSGRWDVIHFNFGLHDLKYLEAPNQDKQVVPPDVYGKNLREIVIRLKKTGSKLIFATTTPVPGGSPRRNEGDHRSYNEVALRIMKELNVEVDDLGGYVERLQASLIPLPPWDPKMARKDLKVRQGDIQLPYNVHFTKKGYKQLAELVVSSVLKELPMVQKQGEGNA